jgi:hypothetical protein
VITGIETAQLVGRDPTVATDARLPLLPAAEVLRLGLRDDQVVRAVVEVRGDRPQLLIDGRPASAASGLAAPAGTDQQASVQLRPDGSAVLRPVGHAPGPANAAPGPATPAAATTTATAAAASSTLSAAQTPPPVQSRFEQLLWRPGGMAALLPLLAATGLAQALPAATVVRPEVQRLLNELQRLRPSMASLSGTSLREAITASGFFTEAAVGRGAPSASDLKSVLRQMGALAAEAGPEAAQPLQEAVADIESAQLRAVEGLVAGQYGIQIALAFADAPPVRLGLSRADAGRDGAGTVWFIDVSTASDSLGELWLASRVSETHGVEVTVWASRQDTCARAAERGSELASLLSAWQIELAGFRVVHGRRPSDEAQPRDLPDGRFVDISA